MARLPHSQVLSRFRQRRSQSLLSQRKSSDPLAPSPQPPKTCKLFLPGMRGCFCLLLKDTCPTSSPTFPPCSYRGWFHILSLIALFSCSVAKSCPTLCNPVDCSTPGFPVLHWSWSSLKLVFIEWVMPSNHLLLCRPLLLLSMFPSIRVSKWVCSLHQGAKVLKFQLQHQSFQWIFRVDFF